MIGLGLINLIYAVNWNYSNNNGSKNSNKEISNEFKDYCKAEYKFFGKPHNHHLEKLIVVFRHGDRAPVKNFTPGWEKKKCIGCEISDNTISNCKSKSCEIGELTTTGFEQAKALGGFIKKNYEKILFPEGIDEDLISYRVTRVGRTHSTIMGVMKGLRKLERLENVKDIPENDPLLKIKDCEYLEKQMSTDLKGCENLNYVLDEMGITNGKDFSYFADEIRCSMCNNIKMETENTDDLFDKILKMSSENWSNQMKNVNRDEKSKNIIFGRFGVELIQEIDSESMLSLISAHDGSIGMILASLTSKFQNWPPYASAIFIEIWCKSGKKFVRLIYNNEKIHFDDYDEELIPLDIFIEYIYSLSLDDDEVRDLCRSKQNVRNINYLIEKNTPKASKYFYRTL